MIGFFISGGVIWPAFQRESANAELGVPVDWRTIEQASVAAGVSLSLPYRIEDSRFTGGGGGGGKRGIFP